MIVGFLIGGGLIAKGLLKQAKINDKYSDDNKSKIIEQLETEKQKLINSKAELESKIQSVNEQIRSLRGLGSNGFDAEYYARQDKITELEKSISIEKEVVYNIEDLINYGEFSCITNSEMNNVYTSTYCSLQKQLSEFDDSTKRSESMPIYPLYFFGAFFVISSCMIAGSTYFIAKKREVVAFTTQQVMPIAQEGIEKITPTVGNAASTIAKNVQDSLKDNNNKKDDLD